MDDPVMKAMAEMANEKERQAPDLVATGLVKSYGDRTVVNGMSRYSPAEPRDTCPLISLILAS